jgi:acyl-CoA thioester hydrolase
MSFPRTSPRETTARLRVRYAETDRMGVVYYANYLAWFEVGRCEWFREAGCSYRALEAAGTILPVLEVHCEYLQSARYDDEIEIRTKATLISAVRVRFDYELTRCGESKVAAAGWTVHAAVDHGGRPRRLPETVRALFP